MLAAGLAVSFAGTLATLAVSLATPVTLTMCEKTAFAVPATTTTLRSTGILNRTLPSEEITQTFPP